MGRRSAGSSTPGRTTAAGRSRWSSCGCRSSASAACSRSTTSLPGAASCGLRTRACRSRTPPLSRAGVHKADDPYRALAYWRFEEHGRYRYRDAAMAPQLWLLRHGEAVPHESKPDAERELTPRGERQAIAAGRGSRSWASSSTPATRARRCARATPRGSPARRSTSSRSRRTRSPTASTATTRSSCCMRHGADARVLVVGHDPSFSQVVHDLTGGADRLQEGRRRRRARPSARTESCSCSCARASWSRSPRLAWTGTPAARGSRARRAGAGCSRAGATKAIQSAVPTPISSAIGPHSSMPTGTAASEPNQS